MEEQNSGALQVSPNTVVIRATLCTGVFALRNYNWRNSADANRNHLIVYQLIGPPGAAYQLT
jgi:hypothetical protein